MTINQEDYIKIIFSLEENNLEVTNKIIAQELNISPASTSQMLSKLVKDDLVINERGKITLTKKAREIAKVLISKHRLWETLLLKHLNYNNNEIHSDSEVLEHVTSDLLLEKLNKFLGYPPHCPHGGIIYINNDQQEIEHKTLLLATENEQLTIKRFIDNRELINFTNEINLAINDQVEITKKDQLNELIYLNFKDETVVLSNKVAAMIFIS